MHELLLSTEPPGDESGLTSVTLFLLSIFGGAAVTVVAGFLGAWIQSRREHSKWLRESRLRAYVDHLAATDNFMRAAVRGDVSEAGPVSAECVRAVAAVHLIGPDEVGQAANAFQLATKASADYRGQVERLDEVRLHAREEFLVVARNHAKI